MGVCGQFVLKPPPIKGHGRGWLETPKGRGLPASPRWEAQNTRTAADAIAQTTPVPERRKMGSGKSCSGATSPRRAAMGSGSRVMAPMPARRRCASKTRLVRRPRRRRVCKGREIDEARRVGSAMRPGRPPASGMCPASSGGDGASPRYACQGLSRRAPRAFAVLGLANFCLARRYPVLDGMRASAVRRSAHEARSARAGSSAWCSSGGRCWPRVPRARGIKVLRRAWRAWWKRAFHARGGSRDVNLARNRAIASSFCHAQPRLFAQTIGLMGSAVFWGAGAS